MLRQPVAETIGRLLRQPQSRTSQALAERESHKLFGGCDRDGPSLLAQLRALVTGRLKETLEDLRQRAANFEKAERVAHVGYWERDLRTGRVTLSDETYRIFGLMPRADIITPDELIERLHPEDRAIWRSAVREALRGGSRYNLDYRVIRPDGEIRFVHSQGDLTRDASGRPVSMFGAVQDVTDRRRAEQLTQLIFERSPDGICVIGQDYRYQRVNPVYERMLGLTAKDLVRMHVADVVGREFFEKTLKPRYDRCFEGEEVGLTEWFTYPQGQRYLSVSYSPLRPKSDQVEAILITIRDLTDHALASEALRSAQAELAHSNRVATMGQLTASIAHEVNQPIAAVVMNAQAGLRWLNADPPRIQKARQSLDLIVDDGERAAEVVSRIRSLVKNAPPRKDSIDVNNTVLDVIALTRSEMLKRNLSLQTDLMPELPLVEGDRVQLQQVVLNLIMNAVDAMGCLAEGKRELAISTSNDACECVTVCVRDTGPGLEPTIMDHVFDAFYTTKPEGMGMGLAICRSIIEAHGGRLWVTANEPRGAVFQFSLPTRQDDDFDAAVSQRSIH